MEEKIFAGLLTWALVMAFVFSIEGLAHFQGQRAIRGDISSNLSSDLQIFNEQVP